MRVQAYAGLSTALAGIVTLRAFTERPNFYSGCVYLSQSNACRMILLNFGIFCIGSFLIGLQRLLYGPLRPIEIEQLWDKAWYAITETALAMTTFRDEVGGWFFIMFVSLLAGKIWGWVAEGRVEILEQQQIARPRFFHTRLLASLLLSESFATSMLRYCIRTLLEDPRPGMMVMFAFEFAVLAITTTSTTIRYGLSLYEMLVIKRQTQAKIEERIEEIRTAREVAQREAESNSTEGTELPANLPAETDIDENEIDVPGWQEKGRFVFYLDLVTDFFKLVVYLGFFTILLAFHGIPIHIIRDVFLTMRSFVKRILDFVKYRNATKDMNARFPDATAADLDRDGTCIICRDDMRVWQHPDVLPAAVQRAPRGPLDERLRPKKLPCGHILHFGCLRSWLERQQVCPTCRRDVLVPTNAQTNQPDQNNNNQIRPRLEAQQHQDHQRDPHQVGDNNEAPRPNAARARTLNLGPLRITFAAGNHEQIQNALQMVHNQNPPPGRQIPRPARPFDPFGAFGFRRIQNEANHGRDWQRQLQEIEQQIAQDVVSLNATQQQLGIIRALQGELARLRAAQANTQTVQHAGVVPNAVTVNVHNTIIQGANPELAGSSLGSHQATNLTHPGGSPAMIPSFGASFPRMGQTAFMGEPQQPAMGANDLQLPEGLTLPEGWSLMPLQRLDPHGQTVANTTVSQAEATPSIAVGNSNSNAENPAPLEPPVRLSPPPAATGDATQPAGGQSPVANGASQPSDSPLPEELFPNLRGLALPSDTQAQPQPGASGSMPDWTNGGYVSQSNESGQPTNSGLHDVSKERIEAGESMAVANGHADSGKGKAKVATVEDDAEESDE